MDQDEQLQKKFNSLMQSLFVLQAITELPLEVQDESVLVREALKSLLQTHDMQACSVFLQKGHDLVNVTGLDWEEACQEELSAPAYAKKSSFKFGEGIIGLAAETKSVQRCDDCQQSPMFVTDGHGDDLPGSVLCTPIHHGEVFLGVLNVSHPQPHFFEDWHEHMLVIYAGLLGLLLHSHRMLSTLEVDMKMRAQELENALERGREIKSQSEKIVMRDELTGLYNRRFFFPQAESALARAIRYQQDFSILLIDIDHFRSLNTNFGHVLGDMVLQDIAEVLQEMVRDSDILARYASGEFVMAVPDTDPKGAEQFAKRIADNVRHLTWSHDGERIASTISVGIASLDTQSQDKSKTDVDRLLMQAETVLTQARDEGRDRIKVFAGDNQLA